LVEMVVSKALFAVFDAFCPNIGQLAALFCAISGVASKVANTTPRTHLHTCAAFLVSCPFLFFNGNSFSVVICCALPQRCGTYVTIPKQNSRLKAKRDCC